MMTLATTLWDILFVYNSKLLAPKLDRVSRNVKKQTNNCDSLKYVSHSNDKHVSKIKSINTFKIGHQSWHQTDPVFSYP